MDAFYGFVAKVLAICFVLFMYWEWYDEAQKKKAVKEEPQIEMNEDQEDRRLEQPE